MNGTSVAKRYAEGFLDYARETVGFDNGLEDLHKVKEIFRDNPDFIEFLEGPQITYSEKCTVIDDVLKTFSAEIRQFLKLLLKKGRMDKFSEMAEYARIKYAHGEEVDVLLQVSYPLDTELMQALKDALEKKMNKKAHLYVDLDPDLLGGVRAVIGNTLIDGSVKKRIDDLKNKLMAIKVE